MSRIPALFCIALILGSNAATAGQRVALPGIDNALADCLHVEPKRMRLERGHAVLEAEMTLARPFGECGCPSDAVAYHALVATGQNSRPIHRGTIRLKTAGLKSLDLGDGRSVIGASGLTVQLMCGGA